MSQAEEIVLLDRTILKPHPAHERLWGDDPVDDLVESIRATNHLTPLWVHDDENGYYTVLGGSRRLKAARILCIDVVPCSVSKLMTEEQQLAAVFSDNAPNRKLTKSDIIRAAVLVCHGIESGDKAALLSRYTGISYALSGRYVALANKILTLSEDLWPQAIEEASALKGLELEVQEPQEFLDENSRKQIWTAPVVRAKVKSEKAKPPAKKEAEPVEEKAAPPEPEQPPQEEAPVDPRVDDPLWVNFSSLINSMPRRHAEVLGSLAAPVNLRTFWTVLKYEAHTSLENWSFKDLKTTDGRTPAQILRALGVPEPRIAELLQ